MPEPSREFLLQLLSDARIKGPELDDRVRRALDVDYWKRLVPDFGVCSPDSILETARPDAGEINDAVRSQKEDGYFRVRGVLTPKAVRRLNDAIDAVVAAGWPPSFVFIYDQAWQAGRSPGLAPVIESAIGSGYRQIRHVWAHVVRPVAGAAGWSPHTDGYSEEQHGRMSVWLGLTDATLDNGCMHAVSRRATGSSPGVIARFREAGAQLFRVEVVSMLHGTHALETSPGDALGWDFDIIHWGGVVRRTGPERRGFSFEYIADGEPMEPKEGLATPMDSLPPFEIRLSTLATSALAYRRFEPILERFASVAEAIKKHLEPPG
jgi:hypothetical protein